MSDFRPLPLDEAISLATTFAASSKHPIGDKTMASGEIAAKCFSGRQLADFLRSEEAGKFQVSRIRFVYWLLSRRMLNSFAPFVYRSARRQLHN
jgi:hypothetical protein